MDSIHYGVSPDTNTNTQASILTGIILSTVISYCESFSYRRSNMLLRTSLVALAFLGLVAAESGYSSSGEENISISDPTDTPKTCQGRCTCSDFSGDTLPLDYNYQDWCDSHRLASIGDPTAHAWVGDGAGAWFKDPLPATEDQRTQIILRRQNYFYASVYRFADYPTLVTGKPVSIGNVYAEGIGFTVYNQSLYSSVEMIAMVERHSLLTGLPQTIKYEPIDDIERVQYKNNMYISTYLDYKIDEFGLWAIVASSKTNGKLAIYKVDPETLEFTGPHITDTHKKNISDVFMVCGKLYMMETSTKGEENGGNKMYVYDTLNDVNDEEYVSFRVNSKFGNVMSVNYNPRERLLFAWDNGHLVTFPLVWAAIDTDMTS